MIRTCPPTMNRFAWYSLLLFFFLAPILVGCSLFSEDPLTFSTTRSYDKTFKTVRNALGRRYQVEVADPEAGRIRTDWKVVPSEIQTERFRFITRVHRDRPQKGAVTVTLRSEVQGVESSMKSYRIEDARWEDQPRKAQLEKDLLTWIRMQLRVDEREGTILRKAERGARRDRRLRELRREQGEPPEDGAE